jgi:radical SAM modification target selenobiotic family peptide
MDKQEFKRILAGISIAGLLAGTTVGCTPQTQETTETTPPAHEAPAEEQAEPAPGS